MNITVANLPEDLIALKDVAYQAFSTTEDPSLEAWFSFDEMQVSVKDNIGVCLKAEDEAGHIIGMIFAQQESPINGNESLEKWVISILAVSPAFKGEGLGSQLIKAIEIEAKQRKVKKMFVFTNKGDKQVINFYHKNGYKDAGFIKDYQYGEKNTAVFLLKYL